MAPSPLRSRACIGLANPGTGASLDADLARACNIALGDWAETDNRATAEDWSDDRVGVNVDIVVSATERVANLRASTHAGPQAKARLLARPFGPDPAGEERDYAERLLDNLLRDLIGQGGQA